jgi:hypothetical protein
MCTGVCGGSGGPIRLWEFTGSPETIGETRVIFLMRYARPALLQQSSYHPVMLTLGVAIYDEAADYR